MKRFLEILTFSSLFFILVSCSDGQARKELILMVNDINHNCPIQYDMFTLQKAKIQDDVILFNYTVDESFFNLDIFKKYPEKIKKFGGSSVFGNAELANMIINSGYGVSMIYKGTESNEEVTLEFSNQDIKDVIANPASKEEILDWQIESSNMMMPQQVDEVTTLVNIEKKGKDVIYIYEIDDQSVDLNLFKANKDEFKQNLKESLELVNNPQSTFKPFLMLLCRTNKNLSYEYRGKNSGQSVNITFENWELRNIAKDFIEE